MNEFIKFFVESLPDESALSEKYRAVISYGAVYDICYVQQGIQGHVNFSQIPFFVFF